MHTTCTTAETGSWQFNDEIVSPLYTVWGESSLEPGWFSRLQSDEEAVLAKLPGNKLARKSELEPVLTRKAAAVEAGEVLGLTTRSSRRTEI